MSDTRWFAVDYGLDIVRWQYPCGCSWERCADGGIDLVCARHAQQERERVAKPATSQPTTKPGGEG